MKVAHTLLAALVVAGCARPADPPAAASATAAGTGAPCQPLETRKPDADGQQPAAPGQTRVCGVTSDVAFQVTVVAKGISKPWAVEPLPGGDLLVTEKGGAMRIVTAAGQIGAPIAGVPPVTAGGQGGLLDVALSPTFETDRTIYWSFSEPRPDGNGTSLARGVLSTDRTRLEQVKVIFQAMPSYSNHMHYGSRVLPTADGMIFLTLGERSDLATRPQAQQLDSHFGKVVRVTTDGAVPPDNPFVGQTSARPEIWSLGHRNIQAAALDDQGRLWEIEHGPQGGDEVNIAERGKNYGWPVVAYGEEYSGFPIPNSVTARAGYEQPIYYWDPVIAPSGAQFYSGSAFPAWRGNLFVGSLKEQRLVRLVIENGRVTGEEHLLTDRGKRIRDVRQGPDGALYLVTDDTNGEIWKVAPR